MIEIFSNWYFKKIDSNKYAYYPIAPYFKKAYVLTRKEKNSVAKILDDGLKVLTPVTAASVPLLIICTYLHSNVVGVTALIAIFLIFLSTFITLKVKFRKIVGKRRKEKVGSAMTFEEAFFYSRGREVCWKDIFQIILAIIMFTVFLVVSINSFISGEKLYLGFVVLSVFILLILFSLLIKLVILNIKKKS